LVFCLLQSIVGEDVLIIDGGGGMVGKGKGMFVRIYNVGSFETGVGGRSGVLIRA